MRPAPANALRPFPYCIGPDMSALWWFVASIVWVVLCTGLVIWICPRLFQFTNED